MHRAIGRLPSSSLPFTRCIKHQKKATRHPTRPLSSRSPSSAPDRTLSFHLQQHFPESLRHRTHVLAAPSTRVIPKEGLVQRPRLENILQGRVEEASVPDVHQAAGRKVAFRFPRECGRARPRRRVSCRGATVIGETGAYDLRRGFGGALLASPRFRSRRYRRILLLLLLLFLELLDLLGLVWLGAGVLVVPA